MKNLAGVMPKLAEPFMFILKSNLNYLFSTPFTHLRDGLHGVVPDKNCLKLNYKKMSLTIVKRN